MSPRLAMWEEWIFRISKRPCSFGNEISIVDINDISILIYVKVAFLNVKLPIFLSKRPGLMRAGSKVSGLFVAIMILTLPNVSKPSIWFKSWKNFINQKNHVRFINIGMHMNVWDYP